MSAREKVKILLIKRNMNVKTLAQKLTEITGKPYTYQSLSKKITRDSLRYNEMEIIAKILNYKINFQDLFNPYEIL